MLLFLRTLLFAISLRPVQSWTYTQYYVVTTIAKNNNFPSGTITTLTVSPTGSSSLSATSTNVTTTTAPFGLGNLNAVFNITVTNLYLQSDAPVCTTTDALQCCFSIANECKTSSAPATTTIATSVYAAVTISNPPSCTQTSFLYTTSSLGFFESRDAVALFPTLYEQGVDTGSNGQAIFVTTYVSTISINLGGQAITTTRCDIWLKTDAVASIAALTEQSFLSECVDPRRYLCNPYNAFSATCDTSWVSAYPGTQAVNSLPAGATTTSPATTTPTDGLPLPTQSKKPDGAVGGVNLLSQGLMMAALTASTCVLLFLF